MYYTSVSYFYFTLSSDIQFYRTFSPQLRTSSLCQLSDRSYLDVPTVNFQSVGPGISLDYRCNCPIIFQVQTHPRYSDPVLSWSGGDRRLIAWSRTLDQFCVVHRSGNPRPFRRRSAGTAYPLHHQESTSETSLHGTREGGAEEDSLLPFLGGNYRLPSSYEHDSV